MKSFTLEGWQVNPSRLALIRDGREVLLEPKSMDVLVYLAEKAGEVATSDELIESVWDGRAMGDGPVYGAIAKLRRAFEDDPRNPRYIETVSRRGYRLVGQPLWEEAQADGNRVRAGLITLVVLVIGLFAAIQFWKFTGPTDEAIDTNQISLAVLPFSNLSQEAGNEFLGRGFSEDLLNALANTPDLRVIARASAFRLGASDIEFSELADDLGVDLVLNGSVRLDGNRIRVTTQLLDQDAQLIWSESFDRVLDDVLEIQQEIALALADRLALRLSNQRIRGPVSGDAYKAYLLGGDYIRLGLIDWATEAEEAFQLAIELDPRFADAHAALARVLHHEREIRRATDHVELALSLDPDSPEGHFVNGLLAFPLEFEIAETRFRRALQLNPNLSEARQFLAFSLEGLNRRSEALTERQIGLARDPLHYGLNRNIAFDYSATGRLDRAREALNSAIDLPQSDIPALNHLIRILLDWTRYEELIQLGELYEQPDLDNSKFNAELASIMALSHSRLGHFSDASEWYRIARGQEGWPHLGPPLGWRIQYLGETGQFDDLLEEIEVLNTDLPDFFPGTRTLVELNREIISFKVIAYVFANELNREPGLTNLGPESNNLTSDARQFLALANLRKGQSAIAKALIAKPLERATDIAGQGFSEFPAAQANLARLHFLSGDKETALKYLNNAKALGWNGALEISGDPRWIKDAQSR